MLNFNLKAKDITRKLLNNPKRDNEIKQKCPQLPTVALPDRVVTQEDLLQRENELNAREEALEQERGLFQEEKSTWTTNMTAQKKKQSLIRRGATIMFRTHRLEAQQEREEREKIMHALENGLLQTAQQELDLIDQEHAQVIGNLLAATAAQVTCAAASLDANARAHAISDRLTDALDKVHYERLHIMELTESVNVKSAELDDLISNAKAERTKADESLQTARSHASRLSLAAEAIGLVRGQIESNATEEREKLFKAIDKERGDALEEARCETQRRLAALRDARTAFEKLRETEKANLAKGYARVEHSRAVVDMEKELVKKEMVRARLLAVKAEQERAASVDAKKAALEELQAARIMRDESRRALHKLIAIADGMIIPQATSDGLIKNVASAVAGGDMNVKAESSEGRMSRFGFYGDRRASSQGQINGASSSVNGIEGGKAGNLKKRCTSLNIKRGDGPSQTISPVSWPRSPVHGSARSDTETCVHLTVASSSADPIEDITSTAQNLCLNPDVNTKTFMPMENGYDMSSFDGKTTEKQRIEKSFELSTNKCDKQSSRIKLGSIGNTIH